MTNQMNKWIKEALVKKRERYGNCCLVCGDKIKLEFAHIVETGLNGRGRGRKERYYDIVNNPDCYVLLCKKCHKQMDDGKFTLVLC